MKKLLLGILALMALSAPSSSFAACGEEGEPACEDTGGGDGSVCDSSCPDEDDEIEEPDDDDDERMPGIENEQ